jgi:DUF4097 and DUF4098 domain-containing protein YvlB
MEPMTFPTPEGLELELRIPSGRIEVRADQTTETALDIRGERDQEDLRITCEEVAGGGHRLVVEHRGRGHRWGRRGELQVRALVPLGTHVSAATGSADLEALGRLGSLVFQSGSGDASFEDVEGNVTIKTASGEVAGGPVGGDAKVHSASGDATLRAVTGTVTGRTASGDVRVGTAAGPVQITTASGDVQVDSLERGETTIRSVSGDVEIGVARGRIVYLDLASTTGETEANLDMSDAPTEADGPDLELHVATVSGDIRVSRSGTRREQRSA